MKTPSNLPVLLHTRLLIPPPPPVDIQPNFCLPQRARPRWRARKHTHHFVRLTCAGCCCDFWNFVRASSIFTHERRKKKKQPNKLLLKFCKNGAAAAREPGHSHGAAVGSDDEQHACSPISFAKKNKSTVTPNRRAAIFFFETKMDVFFDGAAS